MFRAASLASLLLAATSLQGVPDARPVEYMSRAEVVMSLVLSRAPDVPVVRNTGQFADVPKGSWHEPYLLYAERLGIIRADGLNRLRPDASVTRAEFLKMLTVTYGLPVGYPHGFTDVRGNDWFEPYAGLATQYRFFRLQEVSRLEPHRALTRDEALKAFKLFERIRNRAEEAPVIEQNLAREQAQSKLKLYTVISTRREKVTLIDPPKEPERTPLVRRIKIPATLPDMRTQILTMVNAIRLEKKLAPLTYSAPLEQSAQGYADRMAKEGFFGHVSPDGGTLKDRVSATGYYDRGFSVDCLCVKGYALGENLARGQKTPKEAVDAWMKSPGHRDAILNPSYTHIGIGVNAGVWVQHFGGVLLPQKN